MSNLTTMQIAFGEDSCSGGDYSEWYLEDSANKGTQLAFVCGSENAGEMARRLSACWNACEGISTEKLERADGLAWVNVRMRLLAAEMQRQELLAALEGLLAITSDSRGVAGCHLNGAIAEWGEFEEIAAAVAAIAKAKGGAV